MSDVYRDCSVLVVCVYETCERVFISRDSGSAGRSSLPVSQMTLCIILDVIEQVGSKYGKFSAVLTTAPRAYFHINEYLYGPCRWRM
jgi:hypothetical protein